MKKYAVGEPVRILYRSARTEETRTYDGWVAASTKYRLSVITSSVMPDLYELTDQNLCYSVEGRRGKPAKAIVETRKDQFRHFGIVAGRRVVIVAGCRSFNGIASARKHWGKRQRYFEAFSREHKEYWRGAYRPFYNTPKARKLRARNAALNKWSLAFVRKVERLTNT